MILLYIPKLFKLNPDIFVDELIVKYVLILNCSEFYWDSLNRKPD